MSKRPTDGLEPAAKKRGNSRQLTKDDASDEEEEDRGTLQVASAEVLKARKIVKARRGTGAPPSTPTSGVPKTSAASNPFAGVSLMGTLASANAAEQAQPANTVEDAGEEARTPSTDPAETPRSTVKPSEGATEAAPAASPVPIAAEEAATEGGKVAKEKKEEAGASAPSFGAFASKAPFSWSGASAGAGFGFGGLANANGGDEFKSNGAAGGKDESGKPSPFNFGSAAPAFTFKPLEGGFPAVTSIFGSKTDQSGGDPESGKGGQDVKPALATLPPETQTVTGEEEEDTRWSGEGSLYEFSAERAWKERGKGELKINRASGRPARFVMRQRGNHRLLMNANLWPEMKVTPMDGGKGATFPVVNSAQGEDAKLQTFAFRLKAAGELNNFIEAINRHKAPPA